jgi:hypothetical protein
MMRCAWPKGCEEYSPDQLCYWHSKVRAGLVDAVSHNKGRIGTKPGDVLSDEQMGLVHMLKSLGAEPRAISTALARDEHASYSSTRGPFGQGRAIRQGHSTWRPRKA